MGKGAKQREMRRIQKEEQQVWATESNHRRRRLISWVSLVAAGVALVLAVTITLGVMNQNGFFRRRSVSMETANFKVTDQMMCYYIYSLFEGYVSQYGEAAGLSTDVSLKKQYVDTDYSWFDYSSDRAQANLNQILLFAEKAKEQGVSISEESRQSIDNYLQSADITAYQTLFSCTKEDLRQALELSALASTMHAKLVEEMEIDDDDIAAYYHENEKYFKKIDYKVIAFPYGEDGWFESAEMAKGLADRLAKAKTAEEYDEEVTDILDSLGASDVDISNQLSSANRSDYYIDGNQFFEWAYAQGRKTLETYVQQVGNAYYVYQLLSLPARNESRLVDVRHILLTTKTYGSETAAKAKAEELLEKWEQGAATEDSFGTLAASYTEDTGSKESGGLYTDVAQGDMVKEFDAWCFDAARKKGDTDIVKTSYGYHIMYFVEAGQQQWEISAHNAILSEKTVELCESYEKIWPITENEKNIARLPL